MKYVIAVIQPGLLDKVQDKLSDLGLLGMTVSEVQGYGRQKGVYHLSLYETAYGDGCRLYRKRGG